MTDEINTDVVSRMSRRTLNNSSIAILRAGLVGVGSLLIVPVFIQGLGLRTYGSLALADALLTYIRQLDLGVETATMYELGAARSTDQHPREAAILGTSVALLTLFSLALLAVGLIASPWLASAVLPDGEPEVPFLTAWSGGLTIAALALWASPVELRLATSQRLDFVYVCRASGTLVGFALGGLLVFAGQGIVGVIVGRLAGTIFTLLLEVTGLEGNIRLKWPDRSIASALLRYGLKAQAGTLLSGFAFQLDRVVVSRLLGLESLALYDVAARLGLQALAAISSASAVVMPAIANVRNRADARALVERIFLALLTVDLAVFGAVFVAGPALAGLMSGRNAQDFEGIGRWLSVAYATLGATSVIAYALQGAGRPGTSIVAALTALVGVAAFTTTLGGSFGLSGVAAGAALAYACALAMLIFAGARRSVGLLRAVRVRDVLFSSVGPIGASIIAFAIPMNRGAVSILIAMSLYVVVLSGLLLLSLRLGQRNRNGLAWADLLPLRLAEIALRR